LSFHFISDPAGSRSTTLPVLPNGEMPNYAF
jgi:hypothetical protein